jgi:sugar phosphate isomerase/epimerase
MQSFYMHHSNSQYGVACSDRLELFARAQQLGFDGIEFGLDRDYAQDPLWTGDVDLRQAMRDASAQTGVEARSLCLHLLNYEEYSPASPDAAYRATARELVEQTLEACHEIGASVILLPFFGTSDLRTGRRIDNLVTEMRSCAATGGQSGDPGANRLRCRGYLFRHR